MSDPLHSQTQVATAPINLKAHGWRILAGKVLDVLWFALFGLWLVGRLGDDRTFWLQWLSWIPTIGVAVCGFIWLALRAGDRRRQRLRRWGGLACLAVTMGSVLRSDWRPWSITAQSSLQEIHILQWNTDYPSGDDWRSELALASVKADIFLISNRGSITSTERVKEWAGPNVSVAGAGPFACITHFPMTEARVIAVGGLARDLVWVAKFIVYPPSWNGRPLRIAMVDMPSKPMLTRAVLAQELFNSIERGTLGEVDIVAGDFNALADSIIIRKSFPAFHDSWSEAGTGLRNSWPRQFPLLSIDHVLLAPDVRALSSVMLNPGLSMHRMNFVVIAPR